MTFFHKQGSIYRATNEENIRIDKELPLGTYTILMDMAGYYFEPVSDLAYEGKIYGDVEKRVTRILNTFADRPNSTGVMLSGEKGSGKTMLARILSERAMGEGIITLLINSPLQGESFNKLIASITQPALLVFDEFEKVYDNEAQQRLLTLFDGVYQSKKLFVVTANDTYKVSDFFKNRPGRFFYSFNYKGLDEQFVREYAEDTLLAKDQIEELVTFTKAFNALNFDILKATIEEMNRYGERVSEVMKFLNASPMDQRVKLKTASIKAVREEDATKWNFDAVLAGKVNNGQMINPFKDSIYMWIGSKELDDEEDIFGAEPKDAIDFYLTPSELKKMANGSYIYNNGRFEVVIERIEEEAKDYSYFFAGA